VRPLPPTGRCFAAGVLAVAALSAGCTDPNDPAINPKARHNLESRPPAEVLFDGNSLDGWRTIQGSVRMEDGRLVVGRAGGKSTLVSRRSFRDGELELDVRRRGGDGPRGPYTFGLRIGGGLLSWRSVYVICRPDRVEACTGSAANWHPKPEVVVELGPAGDIERWRFVLDGPEITCFRSGAAVLAYRDSKPQEGALAITADDCILEVLAVRYRPLAPLGPAPADR